MEVNEYELMNVEKVDRALNGVQQADSTRIGGVGLGAYKEGGVWKRDGAELGDKEVAALEFALLAEYDKMGGLIKKSGDRVETGSFYDFKAKAPRPKAKVTLVFMINGREMKIADGEPVPKIVEAARLMEQEDAEEAEEVKVPKKRRKA